ncbi:zinc carboxypeptidase [Bacillus phage Palmer]|uniref:Carboxypeptidase A n=1 Tax=Bacillus phage Palmer TaxID=1597966 RepID=A0A0C5ACD8_9CAUD|nr:zinc carboxypeptidase [Bacillus phage Palmer]AJK28081.1 carboxypeptidase A [Bacillus phage Palmer]
MPTIDLTALRQQGNEVAIDFIASVQDGGESFFYPATYYGDSIKVENLSTSDLYITVNESTEQLIKPFEKYSFSGEEFTSFFVRPALGMGSFRARLSHFEYDEEDEKEMNDKVTQIEEVGTDPGAFWIPPTQPAMPWGANGVPDSTSRSPEAFVQGLYEPYRKKNSRYITRTLLGKDQSDTWNIWRYELTPKHYTKTIVVSAGTHGNEYTASFALARFFYHLVNDWKNYPQLEYIRKNVRLIVHPINNPWSFANNNRRNSRGVDLNRNMEYLWTYINGASFQPGGTYYKGTAPFSERESQLFRDSMAEMGEALSYIDFHTINTIEAEHIVFTPRYIPQYREIFEDNIARLFKTGNRIVDGTTAMPTLALHAATTHNMTTANPEWYNGLYGGNRDSVEMTEALKWFGNVIIKACALKHKTNIIEESAAFSKVAMYDRGTTPASSTITSTVYNNVSHATYDLILKRHGVVRATGYVKFTLTAPATVGVNPIIYQVNHPERGYSDVKDEVTNEILQILAAGTYVVPFDARIHNFPHNYNTASTSRPEQTKFRLRMKTSAGTVNIDSWRVYLDWTPTERGRAYEIANFTGLEAQPEGSDFAIVYPDPVKYGYDSVTDE